jgi:hypothetical protein
LVFGKPLASVLKSKFCTLVRYSFFDLSDEEITAMAQEATKEAVKDLHRRGISTYAMRGSVMYETKPNGEKVIVDNPLSKP